MRNSIPDRIQFGFQDELTKFGFLQAGLTALGTIPKAISAFSNAGRIAGGATSGFGSDVLNSLRGSDSGALRTIGKMGNISGAVRAFMGSNQPSPSSGNFTSSASPGQVAN